MTIGEDPSSHNVGDFGKMSRITPIKERQWYEVIQRNKWMKEMLDVVLRSSKKNE
jgi:hypothetical protein